MVQAKDKQGKSQPKGRRVSDGRLDFSKHLLKCTTQGWATVDFLAGTLEYVLKVSGCDAVELCLKEIEETFRCEVSARRGGSCDFLIVPGDSSGDAAMPSPGANTFLDILSQAVPSDVPCPLYTCTMNRSVWIPDLRQPLPSSGEHPFHRLIEDTLAHGKYRSLILIPLHFGEVQIGRLVYKQKRKMSYKRERIEYLETVTAKFELALLHHLSQAKLHERVKELSCLSGIAQIRSDRELTLEQKLERIVLLLPPAWQYPAHACARITVDGIIFQTHTFQEGSRRLVARIQAAGRDRGSAEVHYPDDRSFLQANPFLKEEQNLINNIAGQITHMIERLETEKVNAELQAWLIHADRLAAIGQLAAGVAHELNEPLNTILGFAQLAQKTPGMPESACMDLGKITEASLHARKIIRELLVFARQSRPCRSRFNLNSIIEEELDLIETMCAKSGVEIRRELDPCLPEVEADKSQMLQVLTNLVVNALQAMPQGGLLTIKTKYHDRDAILISVEDTGTGISEEVKNHIFIPFFTTKDIGEGTGLGLAVVHGIVTSHRGDIQVESVPGQGTRFTISLPCSMAVTTEEMQRHDTAE